MSKECLAQESLTVDGTKVLAYSYSKAVLTFLQAVYSEYENKWPVSMCVFVCVKETGREGYGCGE